MPEKLIILTIQSLDELNKVEHLQQLLEICLEQLDCEPEKMQLRVALLIELYLSAMSLHVDELRAALEKLRTSLKLIDAS